MPTGGLYYTWPGEMIIGKHQETLSREVKPLPDNVLGYFPLSQLRTDNPFINCENGTLRWHCQYCLMNCLYANMAVPGITIEWLLLENPSNVYQAG